jgi:hypothetical protein
LVAAHVRETEREKIASAITQRQKLNEIGDMSPPIARPITKFPAQKRDMHASKR